MRVLVALVLLSVVACKPSKQPRVVAALEKLADTPSKMVLYSVHPGVTDDHDTDAYNDHVFHGYIILGKAEIDDRAEQRSLLRALAQGASENDDHAMACFMPRHALHVEQGGRSMDFTICFMCLQVETRGFEQGGFFTSDSPQAVFDQSIISHHLQPAPK